VAAFRGVWAGKEREGEGNGMKSLSWSRGAREEKAKSGFSPGLSTVAFAVAAAWTRRGGRGEGRGHQRDGKGRWEVSGRRVEATRSRRWRGEAAQSGGGRRGAVGGEKQRNREGKKTGT
jgi:hypothetical protein